MAMRDGLLKHRAGIGAVNPIIGRVFQERNQEEECAVPNFEAEALGTVHQQRSTGKAHHRVGHLVRVPSVGRRVVRVK